MHEPEHNVAHDNMDIVLSDIMADDTMDDDVEIVSIRYMERVESGLDVQALTTTTIFQTDDTDAFDLDYDEAPTSSVVFMENLASFDSNVLSKVPYYDTYQDNNVID
nr:hypothetical protein [Tanacetum cinerariifolium]